MNYSEELTVATDYQNFYDFEIQSDEQLQPKSDDEVREAILQAVGAGFNTLRTLRERTGLDEQKLIYEMEIMRDLEIVMLPGPPVSSFWLRGEVPKHGVYIQAGKAYPRPASEISEESRKARTALIGSQVSPPGKRSPGSTTTSTSTSVGGNSRQNSEQAGENVPVIESGGNGHQVTAAATAETLQQNAGDDEFFDSMPLDRLEPHPDNPRGPILDEDQAFIDLTNSVKTHGVQQPLVVTPIEGSQNYRIVMGHRRARAARSAGRGSVPVIVRRYENPQIEYSVMLVENIQRQNLNPMQEARAFHRHYLDLDKDIHRVARSLGLTQSYLAARIKLLQLDLVIQLMIERGEIGTGTGEILSILPRDKQLKLLPRAQKMRLNDLRAVAMEMKNQVGTKIPARRKRVIAALRETRDEEKFTRTGALQSLERLGEGAWISIGHLRDAFSDVCVDSCLESRDEALCHGCPVPRLVESLVRRQFRSAR